ncbi:hypothetical protein Ccar_17455 [Clostridium carboxidivorans P7]|uniref:DUF6873 domain-containing protein n=1 Tax=Clostridium carboxidivorans P7 TaxID=536227 RepID=C6PZ76_9CLOT|nr:hypothetical protein [Clostridium carboxidivorans]AKN32548.1 hypothetical protein Ccar_17455 [Clostridium carboxidivorans P7]EET85474.1 conserved hypothetical protein [Clostridium carboxidivorans P7]EFG87721.1 hypothetical protein CLCAR_2569 [Clostridium carboxidivorans P7]
MKYAIVDFRISDEEKGNLKKLGYEILICPPSNLLYEAVCGHPDILLHIISEDTIMVHKDMNKEFVDKLISINFKVVFSQNNLQEKYPYDIFLNSVNMPNLFVHNIKYTDPNLMLYIKDKKTINVKQGYTKCSTAIVNDKAIITSDKSIAKALINENIDVLLLPPGDILLPGLNYGFIGGCCGLLNKHSMAFYGNLENYLYGDEVIKFLEKYDINPIYLSSGKLIDRGSIFIVNKEDHQNELGEKQNDGHYM